MLVVIEPNGRQDCDSCLLVRLAELYTEGSSCRSRLLIWADSDPVTSCGRLYETKSTPEVGRADIWLCEQLLTGQKLAQKVSARFGSQQSQRPYACLAVCTLAALGIRFLIV